MKRLSVTWILLGILLTAGIWLGTRNPETHLSTQVVELLPVAERDPGVRVVRSLATSQHAQVVLLLLEGLNGAAERRGAAEIMQKAFTSADIIAEGWNIDSPPLPEDALRMWTEHAIPWFWAEWWETQGRPTDAEAIAQLAVKDLIAFLDRPESSFHEDSIPEDPFLLVPRSLQRLQSSLPEASLQAKETTDETGALRFWVRINGSPLSAEDRVALFQWLDQTKDALQSCYPEARIRDAGVHRFAEASESAIRAEITRLNLLIFALVAAICLIFLRRWSILGPLLLIVGVTIIGGASLSILILGRMHVLTLVIGSILIGVAVDYGLHVFLETGSSSVRERMKKLARPLLVGGASTIGGFLVLITSELPVLQQLGIFVACGLSVALSASFLYALEARKASSGGGTVRFLPAIARRNCGKPVFVMLLLLAPLLAGLHWTEWDDDVRSLDYPLPDIRLQDASIREQFGKQDKEAYLLIGSNWAEVNKTIRTLTLPKGSVSPALWMLDLETAKDAHKLAQSLDLADALHQTLEEEGFYPEAFHPFFSRWTSWVEQAWSLERYEADVSAQLATLPGPSALLAGQDEELHWLLVHTPQPFLMEPEQGTWVPLAQLESLNAVFGRYREEAMWAAFLALGVLGLGLIFGFGARTGCAVLLLPVLPSLLTLGALGWLGQPLGLFHLIGAFLSVCLALDYMVFALQARKFGQQLPTSITLSALTTGGSFACLASSAIPAVAGMGTVVAPSVLLAWIIALGLTASHRRDELLPLNQDAR